VTTRHLLEEAQKNKKSLGYNCWCTFRNHKSINYYYQTDVPGPRVVAANFRSLFRAKDHASRIRL